MDNKSKKLGLPLKFHGGKSYLASKIVALMPSHLHYVEPFAGGLSVMLAKDYEGVSEVVNDIDKRLTNFWCVLQSESEFSIFQRIVEAIPFSEYEWQTAEIWNNDLGRYAHEPLKVWNAVHFFIYCRQSLAGRMKGFAPLSRTRTRRGLNEQVSAWLAAVNGLPEVHSRLKRVAILNQDAIEVIRGQDGPDTLFYLDPPYLAETRKSTDVYAHEMSAAAHATLLQTILGLQGKVMISGYASDLYDTFLRDWHRHTFDVPNNAAGGKSKARKAEILWCNFKESEARKSA